MQGSFSFLGAALHRLRRQRLLAQAWHSCFARGASGRAAPCGLANMRHSLLIRSTPFPTSSVASLPTVILVTPFRSIVVHLRIIAQSTRCPFCPPPAGGRPPIYLIWPPLRFGRTSRPNRRVAARRPPWRVPSPAEPGPPACVSLPPCSTAGHMAEVAVLRVRPVVVPPSSRPRSCHQCKELPPKTLIFDFCTSSRRRTAAEYNPAHSRRWPLR
jgi:hypothetical protein